MAAIFTLTGVRRGNSYERTFCFKDGTGEVVDLTGSEIVFIAETTISTIRKSTADGRLLMAVPASGEITLKLTPEETRLFAVGRLKSRYEIERRIGGTEEMRGGNQYVWLWTVTGPSCAGAGLNSSGDCEELVEAKVAFRATFDAWLSWAMNQKTAATWYE